MNWFPSAHIPLGGMQPPLAPVSPTYTSAQALSAIAENVNCLISILRVPGDNTALRRHEDLTKPEHEHLSKYVAEAFRGFQSLAVEYKAPTMCSLLPIRLEPKVFPLQASALVAPYEGKAEEEPFSSSKYLNMSLESLKGDRPQSPSQPQEIEPMVSSEAIREGLSFDCLDDAEAAFDEYATRAGFTICKGNSKKNVYQEFACSARGKKRDRKVADVTKRRNRSSIKSMCRCHIILRKRGDKWWLSTRKLSHTHELMDVEEVLRTSKHRQIPDDVKERAIELYKQGETPAKIQEQLMQELGCKCTWSMKDLYNTLYRFRTAHGAQHQ